MSGTPLRIPLPHIPEDRLKTDFPCEQTILIAEDIESNFMLMKAFVGKRCRLVWAKNGQEAVDLFLQEQPDLIFMDIKMPIMNGYEATQAIRNLSKEVPIVAITAFAFESDRQEALSAGCTDFMTKPISRQLFNEKMDFHLGPRRVAG